MFLLPIKLDIVYSLFALLFRHIGFLLLAPPPLGIRQQSRSPISMVMTRHSACGPNRSSHPLECTVF